MKTYQKLTSFVAVLPDFCFFCNKHVKIDSSVFMWYDYWCGKSYCKYYL